MIRIADQVVADWGMFIWKHEGRMIEQVEARLYNGLVLILDLEDFLDIADDEQW